MVHGQQAQDYDREHGVLDIFHTHFMHGAPNSIDVTEGNPTNIGLSANRRRVRV